ncbi:hypothetical protein IFM89_023571, partial [Coptis chinensis]
VLTIFIELISGNVQVRKRVERFEIVSDTSSCDLIGYKLRSSGPIKKLLAEEMESRRRPPSVIARLMGLDVLPPQQPVKKQQKKFSDDYVKRNASIGYPSKRSSSYYDGRSYRKCDDEEQQEFKDVYEVQQTPVSDLLIPTERCSESKKMEFVRQKFMDVKRLSTDERLRQSKEFNDALDVLDSNKDLLLKFLQEPDSLFTKHLRDLHDDPPPTHSGHITVLQSSGAHGKLSRKPDRNTGENNAANSFHKHEQSVASHSHRKNVYIPSKVSKPRVHESDATCHLPTRIVVLKPNLRRVQNTVRLVSSPSSLEEYISGHKKTKEFGSSRNLESFEEVRCRRDSSLELEHVTHTTRKSREIAKEITRQMRHSVSSSSTMVTSSRLRGYAGDESSLSGNDSVNESEVKRPTSRHLYDGKSRYSPSSSYSTESSVSREAKKRLSERWKMTHRFQEEGKVSRGNTLGEMLCMPDKEIRLTNFDSIGSSDDFSDRLSRTGGVTRCNSPFGISSRDGWKDECARSLPRSRSLPASYTSFNSPKRSIRSGSLGKDKCSMPKETVRWRSNNSRKVDSEQRNGFLSKSNTESSRMNSPSPFSAGGERGHLIQYVDLNPDKQRFEGGGKNHTGQDAELEPIEQRRSYGKIDLFEYEPSTFDSPDEKTTVTTKSVNHGESSAVNSNPEVCFSLHCPSGESSFSSRCTIVEGESPASSKEAGQPSPVSVLEPPFVEEFSPLASDSFEKISADLHGLRMQLQLLKLESSDAYSEGSEMIVSSDEDIREVSRGIHGDNKGLDVMIRGKVSREYSYVLDLLVDSGFHDANLNVLLETWYSPECPIGPSVFDKLEKKYGEQLLWQRSDRRLLFDRINMGLMEMLQPHMDQHLWVRLGRKIRLPWKEESLVEELWTLLVGQVKEVEKDPLEKALLAEMDWLDLGDDVDNVGNVIERLLFDELVTEVVSF